MRFSRAGPWLERGGSTPTPATAQTSSRRAKGRPGCTSADHSASTRHQRGAHCALAGRHGIEQATGCALRHARTTPGGAFRSPVRASAIADGRRAGASRASNNDLSAPVHSRSGLGAIRAGGNPRRREARPIHAARRGRGVPGGGADVSLLGVAERGRKGNRGLTGAGFPEMTRELRARLVYRPADATLRAVDLARPFVGYLAE